MRCSLAAALRLAAAPAVAEERLAVLAVADPPEGPTPALAEMAHQVRAACRDRTGGVEEVSEMRARLLGRATGATLPELERAYAGALTAFDAQEFDAGARTLRGIIDDLEKLPESAEAYNQWIRAHLRLGVLERILKRNAAAREVMSRIVEMEPTYAVDGVQYPPSYLREFDDVRRHVLARPKRRLTIESTGAPARAFVNGKDLGLTPVTVVLPASRYRVGAQRDGLRVPEIRVDLSSEDRTVRVDVALAQALRMDRGPGLALDADGRADGIVRAGVWLDAEHVIAVSAAQADGASFLDGAIYDVRKGALLREGRVRTHSGGIPSVHAGALASFLLTGHAVDPVKPVLHGPAEPTSRRGGPEVNLAGAGASPGPRPPVGAAPGRGRWMRPAAIAAGALAIGLAGVATYEGLSARSSFRAADGMLRPDGTFLPGSDPALYARRRADGHSAERMAYVTAGSAIAFAAAAGILGYLSRDGPVAPAVPAALAGLTLRF